ncbi:MAG: hypothetical protein MHM6MM_006787 [Cercozoa sp. M6MM]
MSTSALADTVGEKSKDDLCFVCVDGSKQPLQALTAALPADSSACVPVQYRPSDDLVFMPLNCPVCSTKLGACLLRPPMHLTAQLPERTCVFPHTRLYGTRRRASLMARQKTRRPVPLLSPSRPPKHAGADADDESLPSPAKRARFDDRTRLFDLAGSGRNSMCDDSAMDISQLDDDADDSAADKENADIAANSSVHNASRVPVSSLRSTKKTQSGSPMIKFSVSKFRYQP